MLVKYPSKLRESNPYAFLTSPNFEVSEQSCLIFSYLSYSQLQVYVLSQTTSELVLDIPRGTDGTWNLAHIDINPGIYSVMWQLKNSKNHYGGYLGALDNVTFQSGDCISSHVTEGQTYSWNCTAKSFDQCGYIDLSRNPKQWISIIETGKC